MRTSSFSRTTFCSLTAGAMLASLLLFSAPVSAEEEGIDLWGQRNLIELGIYLGAYFPLEEHELYELSVRWTPLKPVSFDVGGRVAYLPYPFIGIEVEGGVMPTKTDDDFSALVWTVRGHVIGQYPISVSKYALAPFILAGYGILNVASDKDAVGDDIDGAFHAGLGLKFYPTKFLVVRIDGRAIVGGQVGDGGYMAHFEALAGVSYMIGYKDKEKPPADRDGDGVADTDDKCPDRAGTGSDGCPPDKDGDGVYDADDKCPDTPGTGADGCPLDKDGDGIPDKDDKCPDKAGTGTDGCPPDKDGDGFVDSKDKCPDVAGVEPDGCPPDKDGDGVPDKDDKCPTEPETGNGYMDDDGCPDEVPKKVKRFSGIIKGITFDVNKATIRRSSNRVLNQAVKVMKEFPDLNLLIRGHTDATGSDEHNLQLSKDRAEAVKKFLTDKGVPADRLRTEGVGSSERLDEAGTRAARAKNRRIEFKIVSK